jgi:ParB family chromosome partitioning protein
MGKKALGKGLDALISGGYESEDAGEYIRLISVEEIVSNRFQPRKSFESEKIRELAQSIKENGMIQPIVVRKNGAQYEVIVGERRVRAAKEAELSVIPALVKEYSDDRLLELALIENIQREDLNPVEEARAYKMIMEKERVTQEELAHRIGKSRSYIANMVRILELPEPVLENVSRGTISVGQAKVLLSVDEETQKILLARRIIKDGITVRELENITRKRNVPRGTPTKARDPHVEDLEEKLRERLGTKVKIDYRKGKGVIKIEFYSDDELERILEIVI